MTQGRCHVTWTSDATNRVIKADKTCAEMYYRPTFIE